MLRVTPDGRALVWPVLKSSVPVRSEYGRPSKDPQPVLPVAKTAQERKIYGYSVFPACVHIKRMFDFYWLFDDGLGGGQCRRICHC